MKNPFLYFLFFIFSVTICFSQPVASPNVKCISVNPLNGDVTLTWTTPAGPGGFIEYQIFTSPNLAGPYTLVGTVTTFSQTSYTHVGAGANLIRKYYKVQSSYNPGTVLAPPVDTLSTIFLTATNTGNGTALLAWNKFFIKTIPTASTWYKIYREYPIGTWTLRDSTQALFYTDVIGLCSAILSYQIEISDNTGCTSVSNVAGGSVFSDNTPPADAPIDTVSVDGTTDLATISWIPSTSPDADSVVIYQLFAPAWNKIATVAVPTTFYQNPLSNAANVSESYRLAVLDSCGNISPLGTFHKTIYLSVSFDICAATSSLIWNKYVNWTPGVTQYQIWKSINGGTFSLIATNPNTDTTFTDNGLVIGTPYCYFIRVLNGTGKSSSSNRVCFNPNVAQPPTFTYNRTATVTGNNSILVKAHVDFASTSVKYYRIQRATALSGSYSIIAPSITPIGTALTYLDNSVNTTSNSYFYKIDAMDSCSHVITTTNVDTTILLAASIAPNLEVNLSWNDYGGWLGGVDYYEVYRAVDGAWDPIPITTINYTGSNGVYVDDISPFLTSRGNFSYYVVGVEGNGNTFSFKDSSASNIVHVYQYPRILVPNAFTPNNDNTNDVFLPYVGFIDASDYLFTIFDRTGTPVFETSNPAEGWDGKKKGDVCQAGVYMYLIKSKSSNGDDSKISGTVSLFR